MTTRAAVYLRVSTDRQADEDRFGLEVQAGAIRQYAQRHQLELADTFTDTISGTKHRRENLDLLLERAQAYNAVIISSVDRLGRRNRIIYTVLDELLESGLEVHSTDMGIVDPEDESSMLTFGVRSLFAESDHRRLVQKLYRAKVAKVAGNPLIGKPGQPANPLRCYGWQKNQPVPHERQWIIYMYQRLQIVGTQILSRELDERGVRTRTGKKWSPPLIRNLVKNPVYMGRYEFGRLGSKVVATCEVEPFVTPALWENANRLMSERSARHEPQKAARREMFGLTGHIRCSECRRSMCGLRTGRAKHGYYRCSYFQQGKYNTSGQVCTHKKLYRAEVIHEAVLAALSELRLDQADLTPYTKVVSVRAPDHTAALAEFDRKEVRLEAAYLAGAYTPEEYAQRRAELRRQREAVLSAPIPLPVPTLAQEALRERLRTALESPLPELADLLGLRVLIGPGGEIQLELDPPVIT